jgi:glycine cleavage system aminomethyltransferase T
MSALAFLTPDAAPGTAVARTPMERSARAAGARFEVRDGWNVATAFASTDVEHARSTQTVAFADRCAIRKLELHGDALSSLGLEPGIAERRDGAWWCPVTPARVLVLGGVGQPALPDGVSVVDVTSGLAAMALVGPGCRELLARFCAIDVRPAVTPVTGFRPGSVARTPGYVLVEAEQRILIAVGWALGQYMWDVVADAAEHLGGGPVGADALAKAGDA